MSALDHKRIRSAIDAVERDTTGHIAVRVLPRLGPDPVKTAHDELKRARLHEHPHRNSVLFAVAPEARQFAVYGDDGVHRKVGDAFWSSLAGEMADKFKSGEPTDALLHGIERVGEQLREHFPITKSNR